MYSKLNHSIIQRINELRKKQGLSWTALGYASDISSSGINDIKNEKVEAKVSTLCKIAIGLNIQLKELFDFDIDLSELDE